MGSFTWKKCPPPPGVWTSRLESLPALPLRFHVCEWKHLLIVTSLPSLFGVTHWMGGFDLEFSPLLERCVFTGLTGLFAGPQKFKLYMHSAFCFPLNSGSWQGSGKVASQGVMDGRRSLRQPLSPLGSLFGWCGASECQMSPKGLSLLCALMPLGQA